MICSKYVVGAALFGVLVTTAVMPARAASFDCTKAKAADERAICKDRTLSELDSEMGGLWFAYSRVPMLMGANGARHDAADEFLHHRSACGGNIACLRPLYRARISELETAIDNAMKNIAQEENGPSAGHP
jgi:uncharacterized protein